MFWVSIYNTKHTVPCVIVNYLFKIKGEKKYCYTMLLAAKFASFQHKSSLIIKYKILLMVLVHGHTYTDIYTHMHTSTACSRVMNNHKVIITF